MISAAVQETLSFDAPRLLGIFRFVLRRWLASNPVRMLERSPYMWSPVIERETSVCFATGSHLKGRYTNSHTCPSHICTLRFDGLDPLPEVYVSLLSSNATFTTSTTSVQTILLSARPPNIHLSLRLSVLLDPIVIEDFTLVVLRLTGIVFLPCEGMSPSLSFRYRSLKDEEPPRVCL